MSDDDGGSENRRPCSRRNRPVSASKRERQNMLQRLSTRQINRYEVSNTADGSSLYEWVDEREYNNRVQKRLEDDWIVDDGTGQYIDDGREVFDQNLQDLEDEREARQMKALQMSEKVNKKKNLRDMLLHLPAKKKSKRTADLEKDHDLQEILDGIQNSPSICGYNVTRNVPEKCAKVKPHPFSCARKSSDILHEKPVKHVASVQNTKNMFCLSKDLSKEDAASTDAVTWPYSREDCAKSAEGVDSAEITPGEALDDDEMDDMLGAVPDSLLVSQSHNNSTSDSQLVQSNNHLTSASSVIGQSSKVLSNNSTKNEDLFAANEWTLTIERLHERATVSESAVYAPLAEEHTEQHESSQVFTFYWFDAYASTDGYVYLFGKTYKPETRCYVSCCVCFQNIYHRIFILPRAQRIDMKSTEHPASDAHACSYPSVDVTLKDVYEEFNSRVAVAHKILEFRSRVISKRYAFEVVDIPDQADYLEVQYSVKYPKIPSNLVGETFSHVLGTQTSTLEEFLLTNRLRGPCWLNVPNAVVSERRFSYCDVEMLVAHDQPNTLNISDRKDAAPACKLLVISTRTLLSAASHQSEFVMISGLVNNSFSLDRRSSSAPGGTLFHEHFCFMTKLPDMVWPYDIDRQLSKSKVANVQKFLNEKAMLACFFAKVHKLDPDLIVGHNIYGFDLDVFLSRCRLLKLGSWTHLGRLRRSSDLLEKSRRPGDSWLKRDAICGRMICDTFLSAKELTRQKSYHLDELSKQILHIPETEADTEWSEEQLCSMYTSSASLQQLIISTMQRSLCCLRMLVELNAVPLAFQLTCLAGNLMSRTFLGGRAERNEYLLLHAFHEKGYICPDKRFTNKKSSFDLHFNEDDEPSGAKKAKYGGGLVLEPKIGFYDRYILLMDFNSLYPSIIEEFNICFTTVDRSAYTQDKANEDFLCTLPDSDVALGVLPAEIRKLVERRRNVKRLMKAANISSDDLMQLDIRQKALKLTANSMYGCLGFVSSRFYAKHLAAIITAKGRDILLQTKRLVEGLNLEVIYGDTDSIMINSRELSYDKVLQLGNEIKREVNKTYRLLELDVDGLFRYMLLLKKKKYAAVIASRSSDGVLTYTRELKGLDVVRRDWCKFAADCGLFVIDKIFSALSYDDKMASIHAFLENIREKITNLDVDLNDLQIIKELKKDPEDYADRRGLPHVNVAVRVNSQQKVRKFRRGHTVHYIICVDSTSNECMQRAYSVDEVRGAAEGSLRPDTSYYLSSQVFPVVSRLLEPLECTDTYLICKCLGIDHTRHRHTQQGATTATDSSSSAHTADTEQALSTTDSQLQPFLYTCLECRQPQSVDRCLHVQSGEPWLLHCATPDCGALPLSYSPYLINCLRVSLRNHIDCYLKNEMVCSNAACGNSCPSAWMPRVSRGSVLCDRCHTSYMTRKFTPDLLYHQLCYLSRIFDLKSAMNSLEQKQRDKIRSLSQFDNLEQCYSLLYATVKASLDLNSYSLLNLDVLFRHMSFEVSGSI